MNAIYGRRQVASPTEEARRQLLVSTVRMARVALNAAAASVFISPDDTTLRLEANSGQGEDRLMGWTIPTQGGIAGWVYQTGESLLIKDAKADKRFSLDAARSTGYVPNSIVASPIETSTKRFGVIEVLDPDYSQWTEAACLSMVGEVAQQSSAALELAALGGRDDSKLCSIDHEAESGLELLLHHTSEEAREAGRSLSLIANMVAQQWSN